MAPALVATMPSKSRRPSSSSRSMTPQVKAPWAPPPWRARFMVLVTRLGATYALSARTRRMGSCRTALYMYSSLTSILWFYYAVHPLFDGKRLVLFDRISLSCSALRLRHCWGEAMTSHDLRHLPSVRWPAGGRIDDL